LCAGARRLPVARSSLFLPYLQWSVLWRFSRLLRRYLYSYCAFIFKLSFTIFFFILLLCITFFYIIKYEIIEIKRKIIINNIDLSPFHPSSLLWFKLKVGKWGVCFFYKIYTSISNLECWSWALQNSVCSSCCCSRYCLLCLEKKYCSLCQGLHPCGTLG